MDLIKKYAKELENLRLMDDDFMSKVFDKNIEATQLVLDIVLKDKKLKVKSVSSQEDFNTLGGKSIRLDIYAECDDGTPVDIEIQRSDKGAGSRRARFNSSVLDTNILDKGRDYDSLRETYVIFITEHDVLKKGLPIYHVERVIMETGEKFGDGSHILYVNGSYTGNDDIGKLMHDFRCKKPSEMNYEPLAEKTKFFKEHEGGQKTMCKIWEEIEARGIAEGIAEGRAEGIAEGRAEGIAEGRAEGKAEGKTEARLDAAKKLMLSGKLTLNEISLTLDLTEKEVSDLKRLLA